MARRIKQKGLGLMLDIHYSDTWADPGHQSRPASWESLTFEALKDSVREYTRYVVAGFKAQNTLPDMVQVGNEIICGVLWDEGRVCGAWNTPEQWERFGDLVAECLRGIDDATGPEDSVKTVIHIDRGGDISGSIWFFDNLIAEGVDFDLIAQSFYPWWHGTLDQLEANLDTLAVRYGKDLVIAETAYPWTLGWYDDTHNIVGLPEHLHDGYPATVEGQQTFLSDLMDIVAGVPDCRGAGVFYWAPDWISAPGKGSAWENVTLFSFEGEVLGSIAAFDSMRAGVRPGRPDGPGEQPDAPGERPDPPVRLNQNFPNPSGPGTSISYDLDRDCRVVLKIYNLLGEEARTLVDGECSAGRNVLHWDGKGDDGDIVPPGVYLCRLISDFRSETTKIILLR
jgi:arabinogalactan endo-1,4-beta-galactosidase